VLGAKTLAAWDSPVDVDALVVGGRGARPDGEEGPHTGRFAKREDVKGIADNAAPQLKAPPPGENLKEALPRKLVKPTDERRLADEEFIIGGKKLSALGEQVRERINALQRDVASKGPGGKDGQGTGEG